MSLKITLEVDGQSEHQLAPVLGQLVEGYCPEAQANQQQNTQQQNTGLRSRRLSHENPALLREQIQQLTAQNNLLEVQLASRSPVPALPPGMSNQPGAKVVERWPSGYPKQSAPSAQNLSQQAHSARVEVMPRPALPVQYQVTPKAAAWYWLRRSTLSAAQRLRQLLVRLTFGKEWVVWLLLLCAGLYGSFRLADEIAARLSPRRAETVEPAKSIDGAPGESLAEESFEDSSDAQPDTDSAAEEVKEPGPNQLPPPPSSKAGSHPPPPPAFQ